MRFQKGRIPWNKNKLHSESTRIKIGLKKKNKTYEQMYGKEKAEEIKKRIGQSGTGKKRSEITRQKMSLAKKGKIFTEEHKKNIKKNHHDCSLEKSLNWQGGISFELYSIDWTDDLKESIRKRDSYVCQMSGCGIHQDELEGFYRRLDVHHIDYDKKNLDPSNLITLCRNCHMKTNFNREYWIKYFLNFNSINL